MLDILEREVSPAQDTVVDLLTVPNGRAVASPVIFVSNFGDAAYTFDCYVAFAGATHETKQKVGGMITIQAGVVGMIYQIPFPLGPRTVVRVKTNAPGNVMTFRTSALLSK